MAGPAADFEVADCLEFPVDEYAGRWRRLREHASGTCDVVVVSAPESLRYLCGYRSLLTRSRWRPVVLALPVDEALDPVLCVPGQELGIAKAYTPVDDIVVARESIVDGHDDPIDVACAALEKRGLAHGRIGLELGFAHRPGMTPSELEQLRRRLDRAQFVDVADALWRTRAIKSPAEVGFLRAACEISCHGVRAGFEQLRAGMSERELHETMARAMLDRGADDVWLAVGSGAKGYGVFNALPNDRIVLRAGDLVWVDGGASYHGYACDFIRSAVIGEPSDDQRTWYDASLGANEAALDRVRPGAESRELFAAALDYLDGIGMPGAWTFDVLGHGVGLEIHELPSLTRDSTERLEPGHVVTIEPSLSPPGHSHGHYIVEEIVAVTETGRDVLTASLPAGLWIA